MDLVELISSKRARVAVMGLGYVGLPLAKAASAAGLTVTGIDTDAARVMALHAESGPGLTFTTDTSVIRESDIIVICVPTPLKDGSPDMSFVERAAHSVATNLREGSLVILESTTYPGTTEELLFGILETSGLKAGYDFLMGFSPERIDPGNPDYHITNVPKIVGGINEASTEAMVAFYGAFIDSVVQVSSPRAAEMAKLLENTYRHVNIALVNEIAILCHDLGIDVWEVIDAAATKPFGFQPFYPGPGWGGHCIPVDPAYLSWRVRQIGATARFVDLAREFNEQMPAYVVTRITEALNDHGKSLKGSRVLVLGVTYKAGVADLRESPAIEIMERLQKGGAKVAFNDPLIDRLSLKSGTLIGTPTSDLAFAESDLVLIHTAHPGYQWDQIADEAPLILDTRNAVGVRRPNVIRL